MYILDVSFYDTTKIFLHFSSNFSIQYLVYPRVIYVK